MEDFESSSDDDGNSPFAAFKKKNSFTEAVTDDAATVRRYSRQHRILDLIDLWARALVQQKPEDDAAILQVMLAAVETVCRGPCQPCAVRSHSS